MTWMLLVVLAAVIAAPIAVRMKSGGKKKGADGHNIYPVW